VKPQPEALSYLLRGRGLDSGASGGSAAAGLALGVGLTHRLGLLEPLEKLPLLNRIELDTEGSGDETQATLSGYLGERVYLKYGVGVYQPINELVVRLYLLSRLWVETVSGLENSADIYYSFDVE